MYDKIDDSILQLTLSQALVHLFFLNKSTNARFI